MELVQSLRGLNAQAQPLIKLINAIRSILFWENVPLSIGLCIIWVFVCLYPNLFVVFGPHCIIIVTLGMIFNQKIRKENRSQAELEADLNAEHLARERAAQEQEERFRQKGKELLFDSGTFIVLRRLVILTYLFPPLCRSRIGL